MPRPLGRAVSWVLIAMLAAFPLATTAAAKHSLSGKQQTAAKKRDAKKRSAKGKRVAKRKRAKTVRARSASISTVDVRPNADVTHGFITADGGPGYRAQQFRDNQPIAAWGYGKVEEHDFDTRSLAGKTVRSAKLVLVSKRVGSVGARISARVGGGAYTALGRVDGTTLQERTFDVTSLVKTQAGLDGFRVRYDSYKAGGTGGQYWQDQAILRLDLDDAVLARPAIPTGLKVVSLGDGKVELDWADSPAGEKIDKYQVYVNDREIANAVSASQYTVSGLTNGTTYGLRVSAHNTAGYGGWTPAISATPVGSTTTPPASAPAPAPAPAGSLIWSSDFSTAGTLPPFLGWDNSSWNIYGGGSVTTISDPVKGKVMRSFGAANQSRNDGYLNQRAEQVPSFRLREGQTVWLGFDFWVNSDLGVSNTWQGPFQMKTGGAADANSTLGFAVNANGINGLRLTSPGEEHSLGGTPYGRWTRIVLGMHISKDPNRAWVEAWRDGVNVVARNSWTARNQNGTIGGTMYPGGSDTNYTKFGVYRGPQPYNADFRYANFKLGTSPDAVR